MSKIVAGRHFGTIEFELHGAHLRGEVAHNDLRKAAGLLSDGDSATPDVYGLNGFDSTQRVQEETYSQFRENS